ncbi:MFS transporter [Micromonospora mirobrigensis]|uniref:Major Facilitator Superfamily protein n=1 Tax=Micromonospora mirobrigensis TaxID=262898 RepID=A0A1C4VUZ1_9ACTN|nr:MFS transporter [Micromonospora mirobrigensis]SCE87539.1 Major Facilitator Superfamily protein [Micromonospora mirobrigensis]
MTVTARPARLGRDYRLLWSATVASRFGDTLRTPALALLAVALTRDPRTVALVTVAGQLPPLLLGLLGGVYADRWEHRRTMAVVGALRAAVVAGLAVAVALGRAGPALLVLVAVLLATLGALFDAASFALLPALVPTGALPTANGRLQAGTAVAGGFLGAPLAGVLFAASAALPFTVDAVTFAVAALLVLALRPPVDRSAPPSTRTPAGPGTPTDPSAPAGGARRRGALWREAGEGLRWLRGEPVLWRVTLLSAGSNLAISALMAVLVLYALDLLRVPPGGYGLLAAGTILGGLAGALGAGRLAARLGPVTALRWVLLGQAVALTGLALARSPLPGGLALAVFAAGTTVWNSLFAAYGQARVPAGLLGRVGAAQRMVGLVSAPVGAAAAGLAGAAYGVASVIAATAVVTGLVSVVAWRVLRPARPSDGPTTAGTAARPGPPRSR